MHKAMFERVYSRPYQMDAVDQDLLAKRREARAKLGHGPLVGDFLITADGLLRFTHDWGEDIQTTVRPGYDQSFHICENGHMSFSGSLNPAIDKSRIEPTNEVREGSCWFFSHNYAEAHNGIYGVSVPCRVYRLRDLA